MNVCRIFKRAVTLIIILSLLMMAGCSKPDEKPQEAEKVKEDKIEIGMSFDSFVIERWQRDRDVFVSTAREYGAEVNVQTANGEISEQISQIEYFIDKGVDVIVIVPIDTDALTEVVQKAKKAGVAVICYDRIIRNAGADLYISFDNEKVGQLMAEEIYKVIGQGKNVVMIKGASADFNVEMVNEGFSKVTEANAGNIIESYYCEGWKAEMAYDYVNDNISVIEQADAIMCGNDSLAGEAIRALSERRLAGKIPVVGQDADLEACQRIVEGTQLMTVYKPVEKLAKAAARYAVNLAQNKNANIKDTFNDGSYDIPYVALEPIAVTKENIDYELIDSGFHLREEIYLND